MTVHPQHKIAYLKLQERKGARLGHAPWLADGRKLWRHQNQEVQGTCITAQAFVFFKPFIQLYKILFTYNWQWPRVEKQST